jgi:hypothetical protein
MTLACMLATVPVGAAIRVDGTFPTIESDGDGAPGDVLPRLAGELAHELRAHVDVKRHTFDDDDEIVRLDVRDRSAIVCTRGACVVEVDFARYALGEGDAVVASRCGPVFVRGAPDARAVSLSVSRPRVADALRAALRERALRDANRRRYVPLSAPQAPWAPPTTEELARGVRALARAVHEDRARSQRDTRDSRANGVAIGRATVLDRRPGAVLRLTRSGPLSALQQRAESLVLKREHEGLLRVLMNTKRLVVSEIPLGDDDHEADEARVELARRLVAIGAFEVVDDACAQ